jgi:hypothetical protein
VAAGEATGHGLSQLKKLSVCRQYRAMVVAARKNAFELSPQFSHPSDNGNTQAEDTVYAFKNTAVATKYVTTVVGGTVVPCLQAFLQQQIGNHGQAGPLTPITSLAGLGDQSAG